MTRTEVAVAYLLDQFGIAAAGTARTAHAARTDRAAGPSHIDRAVEPPQPVVRVGVHPMRQRKQQVGLLVVHLDHVFLCLEEVKTPDPWYTSCASLYVVQVPFDSPF